MSASRIIGAVFGANTGLMQMALDGLTDEDLMKRPSDQTNPIGWLVWHNARVEDGVVSGLMDEPQIWISDGWHEKFGMEAEPQNAGVGHTLDQVTTLKPKLETLKGYGEAVRSRTLAYLPKLDSADLEEEVPTILGDKRKLGDYLGGFLLDHLHHSGHIGYLRGYISGFGWFPM